MHGHSVSCSGSRGWKTLTQQSAVPYIHVAIHRRRGVKVLLALLKATPEGWAQNRRGEILILPEQIPRRVRWVSGLARRRGPLPGSPATGGGGERAAQQPRHLANTRTPSAGAPAPRPP